MYYLLGLGYEVLFGIFEAIYRVAPSHRIETEVQSKTRDCEDAYDQDGI